MTSILGGPRPTLALGAVLLALAATLVGAPTAARAQEPAPEATGEPAPAGEAPEPPFESRFLDDGGVRLHYIDVGAGEPVVLIHGFSLDLGLNWVAPGARGKPSPRTRRRRRWRGSSWG